MVWKGPIGFEQAFRDVYWSGSVRGEGVKEGSKGFGRVQVCLG